MKSVGFTLLNKAVLPFISPWIVGGNQQEGMRSGTENSLGIYSMMLALLDISETFNPEELLKSRRILETALMDHSTIVGFNSQNRNLNTICAIFDSRYSPDLNTRFDLQGIDVSKGSACASGIVKENRVLLNMGFSSAESLSAIRFSFSPNLDPLEAEKISNSILKVLK